MDREWSVSSPSSAEYDTGADFEYPAWGEVEQASLEDVAAAEAWALGQAEEPEAEEPEAEPAGTAAETDYEVDGSTDALKLYLHNIGRVDLLKPEQEIELGRAIQAGQRVAARLEAAKHSWQALPSEEGAELLELQARGRRARNDMVEANLRLVVSIAKRYQGRGLPLLDLIQEGTIGVVRAAEKFDPEKGYKFSTYATWWIRQAIGRVLQGKTDTIELSAGMAARAYRYERAEEELTHKLKRRPTPAELAKETGLSLEQIAKVQSRAIVVTSLDKPVGEGETATVVDILLDKAGPTAYEQVERKADLAKALAELPPLEREVLSLLYGLGDEGPHTPAQVSRYLGKLSESSVVQMEKRLLRRLRDSGRIEPRQ